MAYRLVVPANTDIHIEAEVHAGYAQRVWAYYVLGGEQKRIDWDSASGEGVPLGSKVVRTSTGELFVVIEHTRDGTVWQPDAVRLGDNLHSPAPTPYPPPPPYPLVPTYTGVLSTAAPVQVTLQGEDGVDGDYNDVLVTVSWRGRVIGALATGGYTPNVTYNPVVNVPANTTVQCEEARGGPSLTPELGVGLLASGGGFKLRKGTPPVPITTAQDVLVLAYGEFPLYCLARFVVP